MIPKKINYCWFGHNPLSELAAKCIRSWRKYCPDYEIIEWNESNFDIYSCDYVREAYESQKWAFVSDYARFKILYENGGLYFDTDVELIQPLDDLINQGAFLGCEFNSKGSIVINPGLGLAAEPRMTFYKEMLELYEKKHFFLKDGEYNLTTIVDYTTQALMHHGYRECSQIQHIKEIYIYPPDYFCPMNFKTGEIKISNNTKSIHHYSMSWVEEWYKIWILRERKLNRLIGKIPARIIILFWRIPQRIIMLLKK